MVGLRPPSKNKSKFSSWRAVGKTKVPHSTLMGSDFLPMTGAGGQSVMAGSASVCPQAEHLAFRSFCLTRRSNPGCSLRTPKVTCSCFSLSSAIPVCLVTLPPLPQRHPKPVWQILICPSPGGAHDSSLTNQTPSREGIGTWSKGSPGGKTWEPFMSHLGSLSDVFFTFSRNLFVYYVHWYLPACVSV